METNKTVTMALIQEAEAELMKLLKRIEKLKEGDLKGVESEVLTSVFTLGRKVLEQIIQGQPEKEKSHWRDAGKSRLRIVLHESATARLHCLRCR